MNWTTNLPFILDNVDGDLKITYSPMGQKFYQNGKEIKRTGSAFGGQKYKIETTDGGDNLVTVKGNLKQGRQVVFRGEKINLETPLSTLTLLLSILPFVAVAIAAAFVAGPRLGVIGGALLGATGALGMLAAGSLMRHEKDIIKQLIYSIVASVSAAIIFIVLLLIFALIFGTIFGVAFSLF
ncbi:MAG: hypothetical protein ACK5M3_09470 [Dysgonomonas sp.]